MGVWESTIVAVEGIVSLGGGVKALGNGVQASGGAEGDSGSNNTMGSVGKSVATEVVGIGLSLSGPLAVVVAEVSVAKVSVGVGEVSLGGGVKALGDGVLARWVANRETGNSVSSKVVGISLSISGPLAVVVGNGKSSLGHRVQSLGDWVQSRGGSERNAGNGVAMGVWESTIVAVEGIGLSLDGRNEGSSEKRLEHVASLLTQTENPHV